MRKGVRMKAKEIFNCRYCHGSLTVALDLGMLYPSGFIKGDEVLEKEPLVLAKCSDCGLVQLKHEYNLDLLYRQYWYSSSLNKSMVSALKDIVDSSIKIKKGPVQTVVDIGTNDGTLLGFYSDDVVKVGFEPALNLSKVAKKNCTYLINDYFSADKYPLKVKADIVTSIAMFYDLPDPKKFICDVRRILADDGIWVIQLTDLYSMLRVVAIDNICHEHLEYYSLSVLNKMMRDNGLSIFDISYNNVNGGSIRVYICHDGKRFPTDRLEDSLEFEEDMQDYSEIDLLQKMYKTFEEEKKKLRIFLDDVNDNDSIQTCFVMGASTKGNTLLQLCGITDEDIPFAAEVNSDKFGLKTAGTDIKIISEEDAMRASPDYFLVLPWHFKKNILENHKEYLENGGKFIFPLPRFEVVGKEK
jgi:hypothetical protein